MKFSVIASLAACSIFAVACGALTPAIAVSGLGIAGAGLSAYCATNGTGCSPELIAYASLITSEATQDATVLESGQTTPAEISQILANLQAAVASGNSLPGLSAKAQAQVSAIVGAANTVISLTEILVPPAMPSATSGPSEEAEEQQASIRLPALTARDKRAISSMRTKIAKIPKKQS